MSESVLADISGAHIETSRALSELLVPPVPGECEPSVCVRVCVCVSVRCDMSEYLCESWSRLDGEKQCKELDTCKRSETLTYKSTMQQ